MSQLGYINAMVNRGYKEIDKSECPVVWGKKRKVLYLSKDNMYAMVDQHGHFVHWIDPEDTEQVRRRYEYIKQPKIEQPTTAWTSEIGEEWH